MNSEITNLLSFLDKIKDQLFAGLTILILFAVGYILGRVEESFRINRDMKKKLPDRLRNKLEKQEHIIEEQAKRIEELETERIEHITYINYLLIHRKEIS